MRNFFKFLYLNTYAFLLLFGGIIIALIPFYKLSKWLIIPQCLACLFLIKQAISLFSTWKDKKVKYKILIGKNKNEFRPETFKVFMQAPCGRLLTKAVLRDLGLKDKYKELLVFKDPFFISMKNNCGTKETKIYFNEDYK